MDKIVVSGEEFSPVLHEIIASGGSVPIVVSGSSMSPFLRHGRDLVYLRKCTENDLRPGQILLFKRVDQSMVLHRVRRICPDGRLVMNGDGQAWCETISVDQVIAAVSSVVRNGQHMPCDGMRCRFWNFIWYPTRPIRPVLIKLKSLLLPRGMR